MPTIEEKMNRRKRVRQWLMAHPDSTAAQINDALPDCMGNILPLLNGGYIEMSGKFRGKPTYRVCSTHKLSMIDARIQAKMEREVEKAEFEQEKKHENERWIWGKVDED